MEYTPICANISETILLGGSVTNQLNSAIFFYPLIYIAEIILYAGLTEICLTQPSFLSIDSHCFWNIRGKWKTRKPLIYQHSKNISANGIPLPCLVSLLLHPKSHEFLSRTCENQPGEGISAPWLCLGRRFRSPWHPAR